MKTGLGLILVFAGSLTGVHASLVLGTGTGALIGGDFTDPENDIIDDNADLLGGNASTGLNMNWISSSASFKNYFGDPNNTDRQGALDLFDNTAGAGTSTKWCCTGPNGGAEFVTLEFAEAYVMTHFTITSGGDAAWRRPTDWSISGSNNGSDFTTIFAHTGSDVWTANSQVIKFESDTENPGAPDFATPAAYTFFKFEATNTLGGNGRTAGQEFQLDELEYFGFAVPEPATASLLALGALGLARVRRRR